MSAEKEMVLAEVNTSAEEADIQSEVINVEQMAAGIVISNDNDLQAAVDFVKKIKESSSKVVDFFKPMKDSAYKAHKNVCDREKEMLKPLTTAEKEVKAKIGEYHREQERIRMEKEAELKRLAQEAAERKLEQAAALEKEGNVAEAEAALLDAQLTEQAANNMSTMTAAPKADGMSTSKAWEIIGIDSSKVPVEINGMEIRPVDEKAVMRLIKASKGKIQIPGVQYRETTQVSIRR